LYINGIVKNRPKDKKLHEEISPIINFVNVCLFYPRISFLQKKTRPVKDDNHAPDHIEEAIRSDIVQDSNDPQTPSDTGSPTIRYTTAKQNLETDDQGPFFFFPKNRRRSQNQK